MQVLNLAEYVNSFSSTLLLMNTAVIIASLLTSASFARSLSKVSVVWAHGGFRILFFHLMIQLLNSVSAGLNLLLFTGVTCCYLSYISTKPAPKNNSDNKKLFSSKTN